MALQWLIIELTREQELAGIESRIMSICETNILAQGIPYQAALFATNSVITGTRARIYITSAMMSICGPALAHFNPVAVDRPSPLGLSTLIINEHDRNSIFE